MRDDVKCPTCGAGSTWEALKGKNSTQDAIRMELITVLQDENRKLRIMIQQASGCSPAVVDQALEGGLSAG